MDRSIAVVKSTGEREVFSREKLEESLRKARVSDELIGAVVGEVERRVGERVSTAEIFEHARDVLARRQSRAVFRYSLKRAIAALGPTGFPFERYIAELYRAQGYETRVGVTARGRCATHEIDCLAWDEHSVYVIEVKFHQEFSARSDLKVVLYLKARFDDLILTRFDCGAALRPMDHGLLVTNTKFTSQAVEYAKCANVGLAGWNYPYIGNLHELIEALRLHPITALTTLSEAQKRHLIAQDVVLCKSLSDDPALLREIPTLNPSERSRLEAELRVLFS